MFGFFFTYTFALGILFFPFLVEFLKCFLQEESCLGKPNFSLANKSIKKGCLVLWPRPQAWITSTWLLLHIWVTTSTSERWQINSVSVRSLRTDVKGCEWVFWFVLASRSGYKYMEEKSSASCRQRPLQYCQASLTLKGLLKSMYFRAEFCTFVYTEMQVSAHENGEFMKWTTFSLVDL